MKDAQKPDHVSLNTLVGRLREGRFAIPNFQREFEWKPWDIRDLMRSIFLDYYIGSLLLWKSKPENFAALACERLYGDSSEEGKPEHIVLDGQQRLTAMHYAFLAPDVPAPSRANRFLYFIRVDRFMAEAYDEAFEYDWTQRGVRLLEDAATQFETHFFPLSIIGKGGWALPNWVQAYERHWQARETNARESGDEIATREAAAHAANARKFGEHLQGITEQYQIAYIELDRDLALDKVCDIFTQINSRGIRLDVFDLVNALLTPKGLELKRLWRESSPRLAFAETERANVYVLQVMSILRQAYCSPKYLYYLLPGQEKSVREVDGSLRKQVLVPTIEEFEQRWRQAVDALEAAINLLRHPQEFGAIASRFLPYVSILPAFASVQASARELPPARQLDAKRKIGHWYWASVFTNRYSGSVESTTARDFLDVKSWFTDDAAEPGLIEEFRSRFRTLDLRKETKRGSSVYNGIFNLLVIRGAKDWRTGDAPQYGDLDDHHIVPKSQEKRFGGLVDSVLNRTALSAETNRVVIGKRLPNEYLPDLIRQSGEGLVRATLESHFISSAALDILLRSPFTPVDFEEFLAERQRTIVDAIEDLLVKERLDLSPRLRELDADIERVELGLRRLISRALKEPVNLPGHVLQKADERIAAASKKNAVLNPGRYGTLEGKLEYCDLRELQDTIVGKAQWPQFEQCFLNKDGLGVRFGQLAELRNGIRHSRAVDAVSRKDGEAALLWFSEVLERNA
jgi:hypothetical protein